MNWPHSIVDRGAWQAAAARLQAGELCLLGLWGEPGCVHMALMHAASSECSVLSLACEANRYPSVGRLHPPAQRLERAARDLYGLEP